MSKILIADDHPLFREALQGALSGRLDSVSLLESDSLESTLQVLNSDDEIDLLLLDLRMPGSGDLYGLIRIREDFPLLPVVIISGSEEPAIIARCMGFGALGFIPKSLSSADIAQAVEHALSGDSWVPESVRGQLQGLSEEDHDLARRVAELTPQQHRVMLLMHEGLLNKQIAYQLDITEATVKAHITAIFRKLGINNRTQAVLLAEKLQLRTDDSL
ncbi:DNA-binding NarL/FixJ family response regulator [Natronospira proteinivora]|uniref:DNA-binding NarL/FixJ family response regulator n=1 Tax=Natronospira proteinivora TaxID=1807133 RepID=A0ABT1GAS2_9GAMM|nr:response regulator transcription factor [Natronospira proteinivora]MCP1728426.1 DNA-binding NarL/FixJ family response regulator [Natronospira proteinivora]